MKQKIRLLDYNDNEKIFVVNYYEEVKILIFEILSGDGVLTLVYKDNKTRVLDSNDSRYIDFHDGIWVLSPKQIDLINNMKNHHDTEKISEADLADDEDEEK